MEQAPSQPMMKAEKKGQCVGTSTCREDLCSDVLRIIQSKLSLQDHAKATLVCRDFHEEFVKRVAKERLAGILLAEETVGKAVFNAFVTAIHRLMCGLPPYPNCPLPLRSDLVINASGEIGLMPKRGMYRRGQSRAEQRTKKQGGAFIRKVGSLLIGNLFPNIPGTCKRTWIALVFSEEPDTVLVNVYFTREAAVAARGLMLAICTGNPDAPPARWQRHLKELTLTDDGPDEAKGRLSGSEPGVPSLKFCPQMDCLEYGSDRDLDGESAKDCNARCEEAANAVVAAGQKGWESEWHREFLGVSAFLLNNPTT